MAVIQGARFVVSLYGPTWISEPRVALQDWWQDSEALGQRLGVPPTRISGVFREKPAGLVNNHGCLLRRYRKRFEKQVVAGNVRALGLDRVSKPKGYMMFDWEFALECGEDPVCGVMYLIGVELSQMRTCGAFDEVALTLDAIAEARKHMEVCYGIAFIMPRGFLPAGYAIGLGCTGAPDNIRYDANAWMDFAGKECDHSLRNIFGYNIVNAKHLDIPVGDQRLEDWIAGGSNRGHISPIGNGLFVWSFQETPEDRRFLQWDYPPVVKVREELAVYKLFPWQRLLEQ
jgi:hypothetical protein